MHDFTHRMRRYTAGRTVLDGLAAVFLACSTCFWFVVHWQVLVGQGLPSGAQIPQAIVAVAMTLIYAFALPLLLSMLVPTTPAGQLLQKTQWRTIGFPVVIASTAILGYYAHQLMRAWFGSQPVVADVGLTSTYITAAIIGFIVIPALCWVQVTPERWIREVQQAHEVRKLELMQRGELAIVKSRLLWAEQKALIGYAKLLPAEQKEVIDTMKGLLMGINDTQRTIARTMGIEGELERSIMGDAEIADSLDYVAQQLEKPATSIDRALTWIDDQGRETWLGDAEGVKVAPVNQATGRLESRRESAAPRSAPQRYAAEYATANQRLERLFTVRQVCKVLGDMPERTARDILDAWHEQEWVEPGNVRGQWRFLTE